MCGSQCGILALLAGRGLRSEYVLYDGALSAQILDSARVLTLRAEEMEKFQWPTCDSAAVADLYGHCMQQTEIDWSDPSQLMCTEIVCLVYLHHLTHTFQIDLGTPLSRQNERSALHGLMKLLQGILDKFSSVAISDTGM